MQVSRQAATSTNAAARTPECGASGTEGIQAWRHPTSAAVRDFFQQCLGLELVQQPQARKGPLARVPKCRGAPQHAGWPCCRCCISHAVLSAEFCTAELLEQHLPSYRLLPALLGDARRLQRPCSRFTCCGTNDGSCLRAQPSAGCLQQRPASQAQARSPAQVLRLPGLLLLSWQQARGASDRTFCLLPSTAASSTVQQQVVCTAQSKLLVPARAKCVPHTRNVRLLPLYMLYAFVLRSQTNLASHSQADNLSTACPSLWLRSAAAAWRISAFSTGVTTSASST